MDTGLLIALLNPGITLVLAGAFLVLWLHKRGEIKRKDFRFLALAFLGAVNAVVHDWMLADPRPPEHNIQNSLRDLAVQLITA